MTVIFHIDVNSAYLSWSAAEKLRRGETLDLRTVPAIIGGDEKSRHGVVLAKSSPAKAYGIRTGEPVAAALRKCPFLVMEPPDHALYQKRSRELMDFLSTYTSDLEQLSVDECFMDFGPISHRFSSPLEAALQIKDRVREQMGFTVNIGISTNRLLAKMASDFEKPDRVHTLFPDEIQEKMWPLPVDELYMVGHSSALRLHALGIHTIGDLARSDRSFLVSQFKSHEADVGICQRHSLRCPPDRGSEREGDRQFHHPLPRRENQGRSPPGASGTFGNRFQTAQKGRTHRPFRYGRNQIQRFYLHFPSVSGFRPRQLLPGALPDRLPAF